MIVPAELSPRYWRLVRIDAASRPRLLPLPTLKTFLRQILAELTGPSNSVLQQRLWTLWQQDAAATAFPLAEGSLRCLISHQAQFVCRQLESQFGQRYGFSRYDLFPYVLDENYPLESLQNFDTATYRSLATDILQTYDPQKASLTTWVTRRVRHHRELNQFLLQQGVYLISDWAILNDTTPKQLQRIFSEFHRLTPPEISQASGLLQAYHQVYRQDRIAQRQQSGLSACIPPTTEQLVRIAQQLPAQLQGKLRSQPDELLSQLQAIATYLRQYRIHVRSGTTPTESLDQPEFGAVAAGLQAQQNAESDELQAFLQFYRQQLLQCLDQAIADVIEPWVAKLSRRENKSADQFLQALDLFHCQQQTMSQIAPQVGLTQQYQVSRLLKLKQLRADICHRLLLHLSDRIREKIQTYLTPERLKLLDEKIAAALAEQVDTLLQASEVEAATASNAPRSCLSDRLCRYLETRRTQP
ncbi:MAG: hypothetical protein HC873_21435 [Leptolyngbyaceae cyanobacterium SL_1_1]|nr:hypothetical protein [Leptolyngbyaceae cyanobacterium RM1_1_2]NJO11762.1 hypothetical protein [Leptolyngbyaceae cyanobacterium SL_1_1]